MAVKPLSMNDPTIYFRLDPGEPGVRTSAKASESTLLVTSQELRNINRLKAEAVQDGHDILYTNITYTPDAVGAYHTITSGHTVVVSIEHKDTTKDVPPNNIDNPKDSDNKEIENQDENTLNDMESSAIPATENPENIQNKVKELQAEIKGLEQKLKAVENLDGDKASSTRTSVLMSQIEQKKEKLLSLMNKESLSRLNSSQQKILNGIKNSNKVAFGLARQKLKGGKINLTI